MSEARIEALRTELAFCEQTGNPRAVQVRDALAAAGHPVDDGSEEPRRAARGRARGKESAQDTAPKERA